MSEVDKIAAMVKKSDNPEDIKEFLNDYLEIRGNATDKDHAKKMIDKRRSLSGSGSGQSHMSQNEKFSKNISTNGVESNMSVQPPSPILMKHLLEKEQTVLADLEAASNDNDQELLRNKPLIKINSQTVSKRLQQPQIQIPRLQLSEESKGQTQQQHDIVNNKNEIGSQNNQRNTTTTSITNNNNNNNNKDELVISNKPSVKVQFGSDVNNNNKSDFELRDVEEVDSAA